MLAGCDMVFFSSLPGILTSSFNPEVLVWVCGGDIWGDPELPQEHEECVLTPHCRCGFHVIGLAHCHICLAFCLGGQSQAL